MASHVYDNIGDFEVIDTIGRGAASTIFKVRRKADGRVYALKHFHVESADDLKYLAQAENEFETGSALDHPNLAKVHALEKTKKFFRVNGARVLIEYVSGQPLSACTKLPINRLMRIFFKAADGLCYMHKMGYYHADLKPDNIMVTPDVQVKIIDFGLAWKDGDRKERVQGTLEFLAPEQARRKIVNARTDIFNFGATMYRVFTGNAIPAQLRDPETKNVGGADSLVPQLTRANPKISPELDEFVRSCIRLSPDNRPACMETVRDRLAAIGRDIKAKLKGDHDD